MQIYLLPTTVGGRWNKRMVLCNSFRHRLSSPVPRLSLGSLRDTIWLPQRVTRLSCCSVGLGLSSSQHTVFFGDFKMNSVSIQGWLSGKHTAAHVLLQCNLWPTFPALCFCDFFRLQPGLNRSTPSSVKIAIGSAGDFVLST